MGKSPSSQSEFVHRLRYMESLILIKPRSISELKLLLEVSYDTVRRDAEVLRDMGSDIYLDSKVDRRYVIVKPVFSSNLNVSRNNLIRECAQSLLALIEDDS